MCNYYFSYIIGYSTATFESTLYKYSGDLTTVLFVISSI